MESVLKNPALRWIGGGLAAVVAIGAFALSTLSDDSPPAPSGQVVAAAPAPAPTLTAPAVPIDTPMAAIPIQPTKSNGRAAAQQASAVLVEKRDGDWASASEAAILSFLKTIPYLSGDRLLEAECATTTCEVTGIADADPATGSMKPVWEALERDTASADLRAQGLERTAAVFDTGRSGDEFKLYYRRAGLPSGR